MIGGPRIDTTFDVRTDARGEDPDSHSATLRSYHRLLWSKPLPTGQPFELDAKLYHKSDLGEFWLSSDGVVQTYTDGAQPARLVDVIQTVPPSELTPFYNLACTVGAYVVFPPQIWVDGKFRQSINQARGLHPKIRDRFDLTLECIRRHYAGEISPLAQVLTYHRGFFRLFRDFHGYIDHFLLTDLVVDDYKSVRFYTKFGDFATDPFPASDADEYRRYMNGSMDFVRARNKRIARFASATFSGE